jgi:hypothetical protein
MLVCSGQVRVQVCGCGWFSTKVATTTEALILGLVSVSRDADPAKVSK